MNDLCILLPLYKEDLLDYERLSLNRLLDFCKKNNYLKNLLLLIPNNFNIDSFIDKYIDICYLNDGIAYKTLDNKYFNSVVSFNNGVLLSYQFYGGFWQKYIFTYQLDGYIFDDYFQYFIDKDYDYIGGYVMPMFSHISLLDGYDNNIYMNGGISLRKTEYCKNVICNPKVQEKINGCEHILNQYIFDEDYIYSRYYESKVLPLDSIMFSYNHTFAENAYVINNFKYPFCCHGFNKNQFLMDLINKYNEENNLKYF